MGLKMFSAVAIFSGALIAQAGSVPSRTGAESNQAGRLMREIRANATQIQASASNLEKLVRTRDTKWQDYDQQWNMIKPAQERIDVAMGRLEGMQASLSPAERQALDQTKRDVQTIAGATHDLWIRLGQPKIDLKAPALNADAQRLDKAARELSKTTASKS
jgi:hypothetical protein